jgi:Flp pilus assembly protein TadG
MKHHVPLKTDQRRGLADLLRTFRRAEDGTVTVFACYMVLIMILVGGIGVDLMRNEMERTRLQAVADAAVLAAADLDQKADPAEVVEDYFAKAGLTNNVSNVDVDEGLNYRVVTVDASAEMNTQFMDLMGVPTMNIPARSRAEEKVAKVEISMVLDISGSMGWNGKMPKLQEAATAFVDNVLREENEDRISVNIVPYTAQVNAGSEITDELNLTRLHPYSSCVDFSDGDFQNTYINTTTSYEHMQHFDQGYSFNGNHSENAISNPGCPKQSFEEITAFSQDNDALKNQINAFQARANTSIHLGMKWGVAMLDPAFNQITQNLNVDAVFQNRPASFDDIETLKTVILMTDGENVTTYRIKPAVYANTSHARHWSKYPLNWYLNNYVSSRYHSYWKRTKYTNNQADNLLDLVCDAAKAQNIVIWTIGFEVSDHGANVMENCASSPSHFFRVEGVEIGEAFEAIARQINQLRLTL